MKFANQKRLLNVKVALCDCGAELEFQYKTQRGIIRYMHSCPSCKKIHTLNNRYPMLTAPLGYRESNTFREQPGKSRWFAGMGFLFGDQG